MKPKDKNLHKGRFNNPTCNEISVLIANNQANPRDIIIPFRNNSLKYINEYHRSYDPLQYPLLFPYGTPGFHRNIEVNKTNKLKKMTVK